MTRGQPTGCMIPDLEQTLSLTGGVVIKRPPPEGDEGSNVVWVQDASGLIVRYVHMNEYNIEPRLGVGDTVRAGQKLGLTGNTYAGHRSPSPHLHVSLHDSANSNQYIHSFPAVVAAYQHSFPGELMPIAGTIRHVYAGEELELDGTKSLTPEGRSIAAYRWTFTDGEQASTAKARRRYTQPGTYSEELRITDDQGRWYRDFVEVFVLSRDQRLRPPRAWINYYPIRNIEVGTEVRFLIRSIHLQNITIDYGDGTEHPYAEWSTHRYTAPGNYLVTVRGESMGAGPGVFHVRVLVVE